MGMCAMSSSAEEYGREGLTFKSWDLIDWIGLMKTRKGLWVSWTMVSQPCPFTYLVDTACQHPPMSVMESKSSVDVENIYLKPVISALSQLPGML